MNEIGFGLSLGMILGIIVGGFGGVAIGADVADSNWREGISRGLAEYCPADDTFAWKGECK